MSMHADVTPQGLIDIFKLFCCKLSKNPLAEKRLENVANLELNKNNQI